MYRKMWKSNFATDGAPYICSLIQSHVLYSASFASPQEWWEFLKASIKEESISFSRHKRRQLC